MEIRVYNPQLQLIGIVENYSSLIWNRKYSAAGDFELHVAITADNVNYLRLGNIISYSGAIEAGVIENIQLQESSSNSDFILKGRFLESYLDRRLIYGNNTPTYNFSGLLETAMRNLVSNAKAIPLLELGEVNGFTETVTFQATYQNLLKYESKLADSVGWGFRCAPDFVNKKIYFRIYKGLDHTETQSDRVRVVFSEEYKNLSGAIYTENDQLLKTVCYVGGQGEGVDRTWVVVGDTSATGLALREVKLDATDVNNNDLTQQEYEDKLKQRGNELLENTDIFVNSFECETIPNGNFIYKVHYDLGDIVTLKKDSWGLSSDLRITEMSEVYERDKTTIIPTFGSALPDTIDWEDK